MAAELFSPPSPALDANASPLSGAKWKFYATGTSTPQPVYADADLSTPLGAPSTSTIAVANSAGKFPNLYFDPTLTYRGVLTDANDAPITPFDIDPINRGPVNADDIELDGGGTVQGAIGWVTPQMYGALANGSADDKAAIQLALNTGKHVYFPRTASYYRITGPVATTAAGQRISGDGKGSKITCVGTLDNASVIQVAHTDCTVEKLWLVPGTTLDDTDQGWGVQTTADRLTVQNVHVSGSRRGGVYVLDSDNCKIVNNRFTDSVVTQDPDEPEPQSAMGYDIYLHGTCSYNVVMGNECVSGAGVGIGLQTKTLSETQSGNVIQGNIVKNHPCYGIMLYSFGAATPILDTIVSGNVVEDISGIVYFGDGTNWFYGAGIYVSGARKYVITGNRIKSTNTDNSKSYTASAVPAAIAISGWGDGLCFGNEIEDCYDGIYFGQVLVSADPSIQGRIEGNRIKNIRRFGINIVTALSVAVKNNTIIGNGYTNDGIALTDSGLVATFIEVTGNFIATFNNGINLQSTNPFMRVEQNTLLDIDTHGIYVTGAEVQINHNKVSMRAAQTAAIYIVNVLATGVCRGNTMIADTAGLIVNNTKVVDEGNVLNGVMLYTGSATWNPASLADAAGETSSNITVTGAALGDAVLVFPPYDLQGVRAFGWVSAANTVKIRLENETGGAVDLDSGAWKVRAVKLAA